MKHKAISTNTLLAVVCFFCFMGLTQSNFVAFKLSVPSYPWHNSGVSPTDYQLGDGSVKVSDMGSKNIYMWKDIYESGLVNNREMIELTYEWDAIRTFVEKNIFILTLPGMVNGGYPHTWELDFELSDGSYLDPPNALAIKRILMDKGNEKVKQQLVQLLVTLVKEPAMKTNWETQRAAYMNENDYMLYDNDELLLANFHRIGNATYKPSLTMAIDYYLGVIKQVNHTDKVFLSMYYNWVIVRIVNEIAQFLDDNSAYKFYSVCYRLGDDGCKQLKSYLEQAKLEINK